MIKLTVLMFYRSPIQFVSNLQKENADQTKRVSYSNKIIMAFIHNTRWVFAPSTDTCPPKVTIADICPPYL